MTSPTMFVRILAAAQLLFLCGLQSVAQQAEAPFETDIRRFEAEDAKNPPAPGGIVFIGSSSIVRWTTLKQDFPDRNVINRGFGGSHISDSVRFADRIVTPYKPKMVVFFAGTNEIADGRAVESVVDDYKQFVGKVRSKLPNTVIAFISISPAPSRWSHIEDVKRANKLIRDYSRHNRKLLFVDTFPQMVDSKGGPRPDLFVADQLHMSPKGYAIWVKAIRPLLHKYS